LQRFPRPLAGFTGPLRGMRGIKGRTRGGEGRGKGEWGRDFSWCARKRMYFIYFIYLFIGERTFDNVNKAVTLHYFETECVILAGKVIHGR